MKKLKFVLLASLMITMVLILLPATITSAKGPIVHRVQVGGPDWEGWCDDPGRTAGCDANFSLSGREYADGSMAGQYIDRWANGNGFHAVIDCVSVSDDGTEAWVSGVITQGRIDDFDLAGLPVATRVKDNGTSANDPPDQISWSWFGGDATSCTAHADYPLFDVPKGQVKVD